MRANDVKELPGVKNAIQFLYTDSGHVSPGKIADLFGIDFQKLPADSKILEQYVSIAMLLVFVPAHDSFRGWLNTSNFELEGMTPMMIIKADRPDIIVNLVCDILLSQNF